MNEEEKTPQEENTGTEETTKDIDVGKPTEAEDELVKKANDVATLAKEAEDLKAANLAKEEKILERKEALAKLGSISPAGDRPAVTEETPAEYAKKAMAGEL